MSNEVKQKKGRKFLVMQEIFIFGILYITACTIKPSLDSLSAFAIIVVSAGAAYMGSNALKAMKK